MLTQLIPTKFVVMFVTVMAANVFPYVQYRTRSREDLHTKTHSGLVRNLLRERYASLPHIGWVSDAGVGDEFVHTHTYIYIYLHTD